MTTHKATVRITPEEFEVTHFVCHLLDDHSLEDAIDPAYWAHVARQLKPHDTIRLIPERGDFYALLIVTAKGPNYAKVKLLQHVPLEEVGNEDDGYSADLAVEWKGPRVKFAVIRKSDGARLKEGFDERRDAEQAAREHALAMAR